MNTAFCKSLFKLFIVTGLVLFLGACNSNPYKKTNRLYKSNVKALTRTISEPLPTPARLATGETPALEDWAGAIHFNLRKANYVMIHHTAQNSLDQTLRTFTVPHAQVSSHYVIGRDGTSVQMVNDYLRSWHAGAGKWGSLTDLNSVTIGIELDNNGTEPYPDEQIDALLILLDTLKVRHRIPTGNFLAHSDTAPTRKQDPNINFPWKKLAEFGFGYWPDEELVIPHEHFNPYDALRIIGYDMSNPDAAIVAFKRRYVQTDLTPELTEYDLQVLYNIYLKSI